MPIMEAMQLRIKDIEFSQSTVIVRQDKGGKDHALMLPATLVMPLRGQMALARVVWQLDRTNGTPGVEVSFALDKKYPRVGQS